MSRVSETQAHIACARCGEEDAPGMTHLTPWGILCDLCYWNAYMRDEGADENRWPSSEGEGF